MPNVFISYSRSNISTARRIKEKLQNAGISGIFMDTDPEDGLRAGKWEQQLRQKICESKSVLFLLSNDWLKSENCRQECIWAIDAHDASEASGASDQIPKPLPLMFSDVNLEHVPEGLHKFTRTWVDSALISTEPGPQEEAELETLWKWLHPQLRRIDVCPTRPPYTKARGPYRGLEALQEADAAVYFGRDTIADDILAQLLKMREPGGKKLLTILAASGAGKSSLMRAGLMRRIKYRTEDFHCLPVFRPGDAALSEASEGLVATICKAISSKDGASPIVSVDDVMSVILKAADQAEAMKHEEETEDHLAGLERLLTELQKRDEISDPVTLVLPVDQAEELLPLAADGRSADESRNAEASKARALLGALLRRRRVDLIVIMAIRSDSFYRLQDDNQLGQIEREMTDLPPLPHSSYRSVIKEPARVARIEIEENLVEALLKDVEGLGDALPLLAFVLRRIWQRAEARAKKDIPLTLKLEDYETLSDAEPSKSGGRSNADIGVSGIGRAIDLVVRESLGEGFDEALLRKAFIPHLVHVNEQDGAFLRRWADREELPKESLSMIDKLVDARILVGDTPAVGEAHEPDRAGKVEVAHEAVLRQWGLLRGWLEDARNALGLLSMAEIDNRRWQRDRKHRRPVDQHALDQERLYPHERQKLVHAALESLGLLDRDVAGAPDTRLVNLGPFVRPEYLRLIEELTAEFKDDHNGQARRVTVATHPRRFQIGNRLDELGDPRPGVGALSKPFLERELTRIELHKKLDLKTDPVRERQLRHIDRHTAVLWNTLPDIVWCQVPAGEVEMQLETDGEGRPNGNKTPKVVERPFWISKYPLTIEQLCCFACPRDDETGQFRRDQQSAHYLEPSWWQGFPADFDKPWKSRVAERDPQRNFPAQFVNWFQAVAYSRWLTDCYRKLDLLSEGGDIRLPTEWEWQQAATGGDNDRLYPWGRDWREDYCRNREGQQSACSVGLYPLGNAPSGAADMSGLIVEWCLNGYDDIDNCDLSAAIPRATRGGAYFTIPRKELPNYHPKYAVSVHGRLEDNPSGLQGNGGPIRTGVRLICTGLRDAEGLALERG